MIGVTWESSSICGDTILVYLAPCKFLVWHMTYKMSGVHFQDFDKKRILIMTI